jgi:hypothetical protein
MKFYKNAFLLFFLLISIAAFADDDKDKPYGYDILVGAKVGLNFNQIKGQDWLEGYKTNPVAGLFLAVNGWRYGVQIEGLWTMNSMTTDSTFAGLYNQYFNAAKDSLAIGKFSFHSISIPVLFNYKLNQILWIQVGPQYNSVISVLDKNDLIESGRTIFRKGELALVAGVWLSVGKVGPIPKFNLGGRFITGLNNLNELGDQSKWRNQRIQLHIGIGF